MNRAGLHVARMRLAQRMAERRRERLAALVGDDDRAAFARDGFVVKRDFLRPAAFAALSRQVLSYRGAGAAASPG